MTSLVAYIRDFLHDEDGDRWSDDKLLYLINRAQLDLAKKARLLRKNYRAGTRLNTSTYTLPTDCYEVTRVDLNGCLLPFVSHADRDRCGCATCGSGTPQYVLSDKHDSEELVICPAPATTNSVLYLPTNIYGLHTEDATTPFGVTLDIQAPAINTTIEGILRQITDDDLVLNVHYIALPKHIDSIHDTLEIDEEDAIKYYVCGHALRSDRDSNSRSLGKEELMLYEQEVSRLRARSMKDFNNGSQVDIQYRRV
jgi:hypothetical protein